MSLYNIFFHLYFNASIIKIQFTSRMLHYLLQCSFGILSEGKTALKERKYTVFKMKNKLCLIKHFFLKLEKFVCLRLICKKQFIYKNSLT